MYGINDRNRGMVAAALRLGAFTACAEAERVLRDIADQIEAPPRVALEDRRYSCQREGYQEPVCAEEAAAYGWFPPTREQAVRNLGALEVGETLQDEDGDAWRRTQ